MKKRRREPDFDGIAKAYRWLEYATMGRSLERARERYLSRLNECRHALVVGDGDGRFTGRLLRMNAIVYVEAVDTSAAMLALLEQRSRGDGTSGRLSIRQADAARYTPAAKADLVATHFFLDCFGQTEVEKLIARLAEYILPGGFWVFTDFRVPPDRLRMPAWLYVRGLYLAFRILTGLRTTRLPDHERAFEKAGLVRLEQHLSLRGILTSELWAKPVL